jgi:hypothetical protein
MRKGIEGGDLLQPIFTMKTMEQKEKIIYHFQKHYQNRKRSPYRRFFFSSHGKEMELDHSANACLACRVRQAHTHKPSVYLLIKLFLSFFPRLDLHASLFVVFERKEMLADH